MRDTGHRSSTHEHVELPGEQDHATDFSGQRVRIEVAAEDSVVTTPRQSPLLPPLGAHSQGATGVEDHDLGRNPVRLGKKAFTLTRKKQAIEVGGEETVEGVGWHGKGSGIGLDHWYFGSNGAQNVQRPSTLVDGDAPPRKVSGERAWPGTYFDEADCGQLTKEAFKLRSFSGDVLDFDGDA